MRNIYALVLAGGVGSRIGGNTPKQFLELGGKPLFLHSLEVFRSWGLLKSLTLVSHKDWILKIEEEAKDHLESNDRIVPGGNTRHLSTLEGIRSIPWDEDDLIFIHDAARPFFTHEELDQLVGVCLNVGAATLALGSSETVVHVKKGTGFTEKSVPREEVYFVKTPQVVYGKTLKELLELPLEKEESSHPTDLCSWLERAGKKTGIVDSSSKNIKITTPSDLLVAEKILKS
ncbi:IspD/TarI family cytidylyltransferase [Leptospira idonii]|uniref:2-C-methyl-D-erythritol 4-phosphate cytidylyltransferase n=1 Tax=Leptospira idonii TaxID=1193500 RepID=A0A4R9M061_9LEPT|nr:IspD/TarI family cytidylyltransferase [Leptospira idonii]TGN17998.1 2-C-methyl-D-erythritol 4-phosphate cytidylyltransferase [Leptospira idonii]